MPTKKEVLALRWARKSEEEKELERKKVALKVKLSRARKVGKKRTEMRNDELNKARDTDKNKKRMKRMKMTDEQREIVKAKDRERKAIKRKMKIEGSQKERQKKNSDNGEEIKEKQINWEKKKMKQLLDNCKTQEKIETKRTEEEKEEIDVEKVAIMREKRGQLSDAGRALVRIHAKNGMREHRNFGYLREYKQRKRRAWYDPNTWEKEPNPISEYFEMSREVETSLEKKEKLKKMNQKRVERHRKKIKKLLNEPVIVDDYGEKGEYELLRERNIQEFERLKDESGLF